MLYRVMIVEDDPLIREGLSRIVFWEECGLELVGCAANGEQALKLLETVEADICITDIKMPKMDGLAFMRACNDASKQIKFIVLSAFNEFDLVKEAAKIGIENYLLKPVDKEELVQTLVTTVDKLDAEQSEQAVMQEGIRIFRENLLYRWITGEIQPEELKERESYLGFPLSRDYVVGILRVFSFQDTQAGWSNREKIPMMKHLQEMLDGSGIGYGVVDMNGNLLMLFPNAECNHHEIERVIKELVHYVESDKGLRSFVAVGSAVETFSEVEKSYFSAKTLLEDYELCSTSSILWYQDADRTEQKMMSDYYDQIARLTDKINLNDKDVVLRLWEEVSAGMKYMPGIRMSAIQVMAMVFLSRVMYNVKEFRPSAEHKISQLRLKMQDIYQIEHPEKLTEWVNDMIESVFALFNETAEKYSKTVSGVVYYLGCNYEKNICIKTVADVFQLNQVYLGRLFRQETGKGFTEYLNLLRVKKARELLLFTDIQIQQVAEQVGYQNSNYFYTIFKKIEGVTPTEFRQKRK